MYKKIAILGMTSVVMLSGCQSISDQMGKQIAKTMVEQASGGKVKIDDVNNGSMTIKTEDGTMQINGNGKDGGTVKMTDKTGKEVMNADSKSGAFSMKDDKGNEVMSANKDGMTVTGDDGKTVKMKANTGDVRPADLPANMPTLDGATGFNFFSMGETISISFNVDGTDTKAVCQKEVDAITGQGWKTDENSLSMESGNTILKNYANDKEVLMLNCTGNETYVNLSVQKSVKPAAN